MTFVDCIGIAKLHEQQIHVGLAFGDACAYGLTTLACEVSMVLAGTM